MVDTTRACCLAIGGQYWGRRYPFAVILWGSDQDDDRRQGTTAGYYLGGGATKRVPRDSLCCRGAWRYEPFSRPTGNFDTGPTTGHSRDDHEAISRAVE